MAKFFLHIYDWLTAHRRTAVVALLLLCSLLVWRLGSLKYEEDIAKFLPLDERNRQQQTVYSYLNAQSTVSVIFRPEMRPGEDTATLRARVMASMDAFEANWHEADTSHCVPGLSATQDGGAALDMIGFVQQNYPFFLTEEDYVRMDSLLSQEGYVRRQLTQARESLGLLTGSLTARNLRTDPLNLFSPVLLRFASLGTASGFQTVNGHLFEVSSSTGVLFFDSPYGGSETGRNEKICRLLDEVVRKTEREHPQVSVSAVGSPLIAVGNAQRIKRDSAMAVTIAILGILTVLLITFRRFSDLWWMAASVLFGAIFSLGVISFLKPDISIIVIGIGSIIVGIAVNYPLHFLHELREEGNGRDTLKNMVTPLLVGNITTVGAFLCLIFLKAQAMHDLALFGSFMLIGTILFTLVVLPVLVKPHRSRKELNATDSSLLDGSRFPCLHRIIPWVLAALTLVFTVFFNGASFDADMHHINYMTDRQQEDLDFLSARLESGSDRSLVYLVSQGETLDACLVNSEQLKQSLENHFGDSRLSMSALSDYVPSEQEQARRVGRWTDFWQRHADILDELEQTGPELGFSARAFQRFLTQARQCPETLSTNAFSPVTELLGTKFLMPGDSLQRLIGYAYVEPTLVDELKSLTDASSDSFAFQASDTMGSIVQSLSADFNLVLWVCGFIVFFFLWLSFGSLEIALLSFLPLTVGWIWILALMNVCGIQFNIVSIILATFIFGQGDDYTIFITEGLMHEYACGQKTLASRRNSVILSAVLMFIGIGTLIFARHPAMKSLAQVTVIGMAVVVLMAHYLPEWVFGWLTRKKGQIRQVPVTLKRLGRSVWAFTFFLLSVIVVTPVALVRFAFSHSERQRIWLHKIIWRFSRLCIRHIPGAPFTFDNTVGENFAKPALIVCNHQSHLDLMAVLMLHPKIVFLTNDWVWKNPFYGALIRRAEFIPAADGIEQHMDRLRDLVARGYSIAVFPEGTRSTDCRILRFHQGAFHLAQSLGLDILPLYIHGFGHVLPKEDFMLREGSLFLRVGKRLPAPAADCDLLAFTRQMRAHYMETYAAIRRERENTAYFLSYVRHQYLYKGFDIERNCRRTLREASMSANEIDGLRGDRADLLEQGQGEKALLTALVHPEMEVTAFMQNEETIRLAQAQAHKPSNLHFVLKPSNGPAQ